MKADYGLMLVTDRALSGGRSIEKIVEEAAAGGVSIVQLREKAASAREFVAIGRRVAEILRPHRIPLIINDRVDVALAVLADGVHLGTSDMSVTDARAILGPRAIIGLSVENEKQAVTAERLDVDYLGISPVFSTPTKTDTGAPWGVEGLVAAAAAGEKAPGRDRRHQRRERGPGSGSGRRRISRRFGNLLGP